MFELISRSEKFGRAGTIAQLGSAVGVLCPPRVICDRFEPVGKLRITRQRCDVLLKPFAMAALRPRCASDITSFVPLKELAGRSDTHATIIR
jgi:hypothetical protein